jgi:hypothetical protein
MWPEIDSHVAKTLWTVQQMDRFLFFSQYARNTTATAPIRIAPPMIKPNTPKIIDPMNKPPVSSQA